MKVFVIAGEPSGDKLGAALMEGLIHEVPDVTFEGIGGALMQNLGVKSLFPMEELSLMGIAEILPKYRHLKRRIRQTADAVIAAKPDVLITIDSPDFCLRVARLVKAGSNIRTVHYVAPTVWAWRPKRAEKMAQVIDHVLALFPFEPPFMEAAGMDCDFVGHPVAAEPPVTQDEIDAFKSSHGITQSPILAILPGSRRSEIARLAETFDAAFTQTDGAFRTVIVPTLPHLVEAVTTTLPLRNTNRCILSGDGLSPEAAARERLVAMACADVALAASGTVSLELAAVRTPMVIAYDMSWLSRQIISRMLLTDTVTLVNLVSETRVVPEFIGADCTPTPIAEALTNVLGNPDEQLDALDVTMERLGRGGDAPGLRAARAVLARL
ncbi:lipid-A-disaccharide synthase [Octadecabacter temperatus]|uniref:Lipid-A-disaccharide synthase n=1 Tax=Octadecabacter temperatus TaxID=1458307 RepID=A0A0K0Y4M5_9RHOB|nr:lipid-A-disaccharide synthase [Octadecabacter temperatus]AKS45948.1 Lipid-A-disaccharide synthase [Octadecabacter temperatus]SIO04179.1 lipid-A-disaccharide synthase [Octadecabacter temperatus]